jgi:hypothetical protein
MSKKSRYLIIAAGFITFLILAPLLVLYVSGVSYDFKTHQFFRTGIMGFQTDPKDVSIFLNGKLSRKSSGEVNFIKPGEYQVAVKKDGYRDWTKRLVIQTNKVTWASPVPNKLVLFLKDTPPDFLASGVTDFFLNGDTIIYSTKTAIGIASLTNPKENNIIPIPFSENTSLQNPFRLIPSADNNFAALIAEDGTISGVFDLKAKKITDITGLFKKPVEIQFSDNDELYVLEDGNLYKVVWKLKEKIIQATEVQTYILQNNNLYLLRRSATTSVLTLADSSSLEEQVLSTSLPAFSNVKIIVNFQKQIFLIGDGSLYKINSTLQKLANSISSWWFNLGDSSLVVVNSGELNFYNQYDEKINLVTRSEQPLTNPVLAPSISYAFTFKGNNLEGLELDTRDHQNEYSFYTATKPQKFILDSALENIYILDDGNLKSIKIR